MPRRASKDNTIVTQLSERLARLEQAGNASTLPQLLTVQELATFLRTTAKAVRLMHARGQLPPPVDLGTRRLLWRQDDVASWLVNRTRSRTEVGSR